MTAASQTPGEPAALDALLLLAQREHRAGRLAEAAVAWRKILAMRPDVADAHNNLGIVLAQQGQLSEAETHFQHALALAPNYVQAHHNLGHVMLSQGKLGEAAAQYEQVIALKPDSADVYNSLGSILSRQGKFREATVRFEQAVACKPDYAEAFNNLGAVLWKQGKLDEAAERYEQALALRPDFSEALNNLGALLRNQGKLTQAEMRCRQALALRPDYAQAHNNLGNVLRSQGKIDEAAAHYQQAVARQPDYPEAQLGLAGCYLVKGDYQRGWLAYEWRLRMPGLTPPRSLPRWTGQPLAGRSLLLLAEQGFGDTFHFIRYARLLKELGARIVLAAPAALSRLLGSQPYLDELFILGSGLKLPRCDFYLPLLSAPGALETDASTIPCEIPYLAADPELTEHWRRELAAIDGFKIGIVWQGARDFDADRWRSIPLAHFAPLARLPGVRLVSLQKGFGSEQVGTVDFPVLDLAGRLDDVAGPFMDTAAVIRSLDLVVAPDTAIAHLAGALGTPVWVAIQFSAEWRWLLYRDESPWYPTMRLFRQTTFDQWPEVIERIAKAVASRRSETVAESNPGGEKPT